MGDRGTPQQPRPNTLVKRLDWRWAQLLSKLNTSENSTSPWPPSDRPIMGHRCSPPLSARPMWTCGDCGTRWRYVDFLPRRHGGPYGWVKTVIQPRPWFTPGWWR